MSRVSFSQRALGPGGILPGAELATALAQGRAWFSVIRKARIETVECCRVVRNMQVFNCQTFRQFLGQPNFSKNHSWGREKRYVVTEASLLEYEDLLKGTLYHHHTSFDIFDEVSAMGYPLTAKAIRQRNSGNPRDEKTQMAHLGEVIGAEFVRTFLDFKTTQVFPKRFNPNVDQSMKGADIIGLRDNEQPARLLIGEAKSYKGFDKRAIDEAYDHLVALHAKEASRMLRFMKEILRRKDDKLSLVNVDRHMADSVPRSFIIISISQSAPRNPFDILTEKFKCSQLPDLMAVHIQIQNLREKKIEDGQHSEKTWLSRLFTW